MKEIKPETMLYPYRVYLTTGHALPMWLPYQNAEDFEKDLMKAKKSKTPVGLSAFGFSANNASYTLFADVSNIAGFDTASLEGPRTLKKNAEQLKADRTKNAKKKQQHQTVTVGQTVKQARK